MTDALDRRTVLRLGLGAAGLAASGGALAACTDDADRTGPYWQGRVIVVGAGLAGLTCALDLVARGWDVNVVEARQRVGGRVRTVREPFIDDMHAEAGGESIDVDHKALLAMIERFGLRTEDRPKDKILQGATAFKGSRQRTSAFVAQRGGGVGRDYERFYAALEKLGADVDPAHPEAHPRAEELDAMPVSEFVDRLDLGPEARFLVDTDNRSEFNIDPRHLSTLFLAQQWAVGSDVSDEGVEAMRIKGGNDRLPTAMAEALGARVMMGIEVTEIIEERDFANRRIMSVRTTGRTFHGAWVVLACPLPTIRNLRFSPELPAELRRVVGHVGLGQAAKVTIGYRERFWEAAGLSGFTVTDQPFGVAWASTDSYDSERGLLTAFITGRAAVAAAEQQESARIASVWRQFDRVYPEGRDLHDGRDATTAWNNERFTGGGYGVWRPGQMVRGWPALRAGAGRIKFAGEHTEELAGYMESAVRSGHRVAKEIPDPPVRRH